MTVIDKPRLFQKAHETAAPTQPVIRCPTPCRRIATHKLGRSKVPIRHDGDGRCSTSPRSTVLKP